MAPVDTTAPVARPPEMSGNPVRRVVGDLWEEWRERGKFPPGRCESGRAVRRSAAALPT